MPFRFPVCLLCLSYVSSGTVVRLNLVRSLSLCHNVSVRSETSKIVAFAVYASVTPDRITVNGLLLAPGRTGKMHSATAQQLRATQPCHETTRQETLFTPAGGLSPTAGTRCNGVPTRNDRSKSYRHLRTAESSRYCQVQYGPARSGGPNHARW
jgi:hypothetical protein